MRPLIRPTVPFARATAACAALVLALAASPGLAAAPSAVTPADPGAEVVLRALSLLGVNYRWGGNTPESGLDCSGLVHHVFHDSLGLLLPRRSEEMSRVGGSIRASDLQPGDLVFFNTLRRAFSHVGIYIGDNRFVHAPSAGKQVRIERLDQPYWTRRFDGARRLLVADGLPPPTTLASLAAPAPKAAAAPWAARPQQNVPRATTAARTRGAVPTPSQRLVAGMTLPDIYTH
jgi:hypothetical protein